MLFAGPRLLACLPNHTRRGCSCRTTILSPWQRLLLSAPAICRRCYQPKPEPSILVIGERTDNRPEKLDHIMPEVDGTKITVTKKTSVTKLDLVPTIADNNQRELFARTPGLFVSEQPAPTQFNLSYRGLGNPQEAEYVLLLQDGLPISTDWIGFPTAYYMPLPQSLSEVQLIRGGSSLLYGPNPAPALNLVSKRPAANQATGGYSENVVGSNGLFSSYNSFQGSSGQALGPSQPRLREERRPA